MKRNIDAISLPARGWEGFTAMDINRQLKKHDISAEDIVNISIDMRGKDKYIIVWHRTVKDVDYGDDDG